MTFQEAVSEVVAGRAKGVRIDYAEYITNDGILSFDGPGGSGIYIPASSFLRDDWEVIDPIPQTERVEVKRWICLACKGIYQQHTAICCGKQLVELTGHYDRPVPRKVKRRAAVLRDHIMSNYVGVHNVPATAKFFAEWEEEITE